MPRIFKGIESELRLLLHPCILTGEITDIKVALFTNDPSVAIEFTDRYTIDDNILTLTVPTWAFGTMEDGVINYVIQGMHNDDAFITDRQSNYYLKTPTDYIPEEMPKEVVLGEFTTMIVENGVFEYTPSDIDAWNKATIEVNVPDTNGSYDEGYNQGYEDGQNSVECPECDTCNLGEGSILLDTTMTGTYTLYASDDGYDGWSKFIVTLEGGGAIKIHKASDLLDTFNNGGNIDYGAYYYVGGEITDIQEINTQYGNATYTLDNGFSVYRGKWIDGNLFGEDQIKVGAYIVVYGVIAEYRGTLQFNAGSQVIAYQECEGGEVVSCNIQDYKWVRPSMADRAENGDIYIYPDEGFDAVGYIDFDPSGIYNEGVSAGKAEGGDLNIGTGDIYLTANERGQRFEILPSEFEYDAFDKFIVEMENFDLGDDANIYLSNEFVTMFWDGKLTIGKTYIVKGQITDIQRIRPEYGDARYTLDGGFNIYNGQTMGYDLQIFDWVIVSGILSEYDGSPQFSAGSEIKALWREGGSGNCDDAYNNGYNDGYGNGYNDGQANCEGGSCNLINPIFYSETEGNTINAENVEIPTFVYEGNQYYNVWPLNMAEYEEFKIHIRFQPNNGGYDEPVNIFGCEDTDWDDTTFGARIYMGNIYFRMSGMDVAYQYNESAWYDVEMGYNSSKRWITVNGETTLETDHAFFNKPSQTFMIGAINSGGNAFRPFYGKIAAAYVEANGSQVWLLPKEDGHMDVYWNSKDHPWVQISGDNNARFESDWMSGDGMKSITWLGKRVSCPSAQEQVNEYYYCPLILGDTGFGEAAKSWDAGMVTLNDYDGNIIEDKLYVPTYGNRNEFRTKTKAKIVQTLYNVGAIGSIEFGSGVEYIALYSPLDFTKLTKLIIGEDMQTANFGTSTFPIIKEIWSYSTTSEIDVYFSLGSTFNGGGTLYLKNKDHETEWRNHLPSDWTIVYI